jgi:hypothetical protein
MFIRNNKSNNQKIAKEEFQQYQENSLKNMRKQETQVNNEEFLNRMNRARQQQQEGSALEVREITDNYIQIGPDSMIQAGTKTSKPDKDNVYEVVDPEENFQSDLELLQDKMRLMIHDSALVHLNEKAQIIQMMHDSKMRQFMTEILQEISAPKSIENVECIRLIADILRFVLTLFVHEEGADYRLLSVILDVSQNLFYVNNKRK